MERKPDVKNYNPNEMETGKGTTSDHNKLFK